MAEAGICCWYDTIGELLKQDRGQFMDIMKTALREHIQQPIDSSGLKSWRDEFKVLKYHTFGAFDRKTLASWKCLKIAFECVLPNQRRPDVLIFSERMIVVIEFKRRDTEFAGYLNQLRSYCRQLEKWEDVVRGRKVRGILCYTGLKPKYVVKKRRHICSGDKLKDALLRLLGDSPKCEGHINAQL